MSKLLLLIILLLLLMMMILMMLLMMTLMMMMEVVVVFLHSTSSIEEPGCINIVSFLRSIRWKGFPSMICQHMSTGGERIRNFFFWIFFQFYDLNRSCSGRPCPVPRRLFRTVRGPCSRSRGQWGAPSGERSSWTHLLSNQPLTTESMESRQNRCQTY